MTTQQHQTLYLAPPHRYRWLARLIAILAVINFSLVLFDLSYVPWRDFYFRELPRLTQLYDPVKDIKPHRETQYYLHKVDELESQIAQTSLDSSSVQNLLQELRSLSNEMIEDNPFALANKTGTLEKIKNQIRDRVKIKSAHQAFAYFWTLDHLAQAGWQQELNFFDTHIRPLIQTNYFRGIGTNGKFIDYFWLIDLPFIILFGLDFIARTFYILRIHPQLTWLQAVLRHWYDLFLLLPLARELRVVSVTIRLYQAELLDIEPVRAQIRYDFVTNFAEELSEIVVIRVINQAQEAIKQGAFAHWLFAPTRRRYVNINNTNEIQAIATRIVNLTIYQVLPKIQPDIESLIKYNIKNILNQSPVYQQIQQIPALGRVSKQLTENLAEDISKTAYTALQSSLEDPQVVELTNRLVQNFSTSFQAEIKKEQNFDEIETLLIDLLEEIKINYVKDIATTEVEKTLEEAALLRKIERENSRSNGRTGFPSL